MARKSNLQDPVKGLFGNLQPLNAHEDNREMPAPSTAEQKDKKNPHPGKGAEDLVVVPEKKETRSRKKQILLKPSLHDAVEAKCNELDISMNEVINQLLQKWIQG